MGEFEDLVRRTRCFRRFDPSVSISNEFLESIIDTARYTSSPLNKQPLRYIIVNTEEYKDKVFAPLKWASHLEDWNGPSELEKPSAYIIVLNHVGKSDYHLIDAGIVMQTMMLHLSSYGLNGCMMASIDKALYREIFDIEEAYEPLFALAIGFGSEKVETIALRDSENGMDYYRDENDTHIVPKRGLTEVLLGSF